MKTYLLLFLLFLSGLAFSQNGNYSFAGARGLAMGHTGIVFQDISGFLKNPASLAHLTSWQGIASAEQRFFSSDINHFVLGAGLPTNSGNFGFVIDYYGFDAYNEQKIGLAYARSFSDKFSIGAQFDYLNVQIEEFGNKGLLTFELGFQFQIAKELLFASHIYNPIRADLLEDEPIPSIFNLGLAYLPSKKVVIVSEFEKDIDQTARLKFGMEYQFIEQLTLRAGVATEPTSATFGIGLNLPKNILIDVASAYHQNLGFTPSISFIFRGN